MTPNQPPSKSQKWHKVDESAYTILPEPGSIQTILQKAGGLRREARGTGHLPPANFG